MRLAVDANPLLSALIGGRARLALEHPSIEEAVTVRTVMEELAEHLPLLAEKRRLSFTDLRMTLAALPVRVAAEEDYRSRLAEARRRVGDRDPDDVDLLALALALAIPIWSNDNDFEDVGVRRYTTARLLKKLGNRTSG